MKEHEKRKKLEEKQYTIPDEGLRQPKIYAIIDKL